MTAEQLVRDQLDRATRDVPSSPDLETAVRQGRRRRRQRRSRIAVAAVAVLGLGAVGLRIATADEGRTVVDDTPVAEAPAASAPDDFVPGTDIDDGLAAVVAGHLPSLPAPDDVYPSDSHTAGPIPDANWAAAEDWQATYTVGDRQVLVMMSLPAEPFSCPGCERTTVPGGTLYEQSYRSGGLTWHGVWLARPDGTSAGVLEGAPGSAEPSLDPDAVAALLRDPALRFSVA